MRHPVLATDYDATLAEDGRVAQETICALERWRAAGRRLILVTGREVADLRSVFPRLNLFDAVVAENGGVLLLPPREEAELLTRPADQELRRRLSERGVKPLSVGQTIIATTQWHAETVRQEIEALGLKVQVILNKSSLMVLPAGVDKASGLKVALQRLGLSEQQAVGVGDAENDLVLLELCGLAVAVANALPAVRDRADWVTVGDSGAGVREVIDRLMAEDASRPTRG